MDGTRHPLSGLTVNSLQCVRIGFSINGQLDDSAICSFSKTKRIPMKGSVLKPF